MMYTANNELIETDKRIKVCKIASTNKNVTAAKQHIIDASEAIDIEWRRDIMVSRCVPGE